MMPLIYSICILCNVLLVHGDHGPTLNQLPIIAGLLASILHVVSGPDHLAAVTPIAIETRQKVWRIGFFWGLGHLLGMLLIGLLFLFFKEKIPIEKISEHSEQLVGLVLIGVGLWGLFVMFRGKTQHSHPHVHNGSDSIVHVHPHDHGNPHVHHHHTHEKKIRQNTWSAFGIGILHGLAGVAHFLLLLPVLGFEHQSESLQYIIGFALGTILAMTSYAFVLGQLSQKAKTSTKTSLFRTIQLSGAIFAIVVGIYWLCLGF
ncbi:MAG: sulfite exporter TauE/SafE family protein [Flavobacteriaceae bacterium]